MKYLLALTLALAAPLYAQTAPANWTSQMRDGGARTFAPNDLKTGEIYSVTVYPSAPLDQPLQAWLRAFAGAVGTATGQLSTPLQISATDAKIASASGQYNAPGGAKLGVLFSAFSLDGESVVATRTLFSDAALLARYQKASGALTQSLIENAARENNRSLWDKVGQLKRVDNPLGVYEGWQTIYGNDYISADQKRAQLRLELYEGGEYRLTVIGGGADFRVGGGGTYSFKTNGDLIFDTALSSGLGSGGHYESDEDQFCVVGRDASGAAVIYAAGKYPSREAIFRLVAPAKPESSPSQMAARATLAAQQKAATEAKAARDKWAAQPGAGLKSEQIAAILNRHDVQIRAGGLAGMVSDVTDEVYLLLRDGTVYRGLPGPPDEISLSKLRQLDKADWGQWRASGKPNSWQISIGGEPFRAIEADKAAPAMAGLKFNADYVAYSSSSDVFGGSYGQSRVSFTAAGRFSRTSSGGSYGALGASIGGANVGTTFDDDGSTTSATTGAGIGVEARAGKKNPRGDREGNYTSSGYALTLRYDNGKVERLPLLRFFDGGTIWLDGTRMTREK